MIRARIHESAGKITSFRVSGHADYGDPGQDVVCAAVSALVLNAVNSCEQLLGVELDAVDDGDEVRCSVPASATRRNEVELLLRSMAFGLAQAAREYPDHIQLTHSEAANEDGE